RFVAEGIGGSICRSRRAGCSARRRRIVRAKRIIPFARFGVPFDRGFQRGEVGLRVGLFVCPRIVGWRRSAERIVVNRWFLLWSCGTYINASLRRYARRNSRGVGIGHVVGDDAVDWLIMELDARCSAVFRVMAAAQREARRATASLLLAAYTIGRQDGHSD